MKTIDSTKTCLQALIGRFWSVSMLAQASSRRSSFYRLSVSLEVRYYSFNVFYFLLGEKVNVSDVDDS